MIVALRGNPHWTSPSGAGISGSTFRSLKKPVLLPDCRPTPGDDIYYIFLDEIQPAGPELIRCGRFVADWHGCHICSRANYVIGRRGFANSTGKEDWQIYFLPSPTRPSTLYAMPLKGHQRTERQKAHIAAMRKQRWLSKSGTHCLVCVDSGRPVLLVGCCFRDLLVPL